MKPIRRLILAGFAALSLLSSIATSFAQVPAPVPALPDAERRTSYSISASTCGCNVNFALFGDAIDVGNWIEVFVNGVLIPQAGNWNLTSPSGPIANLSRPITDAVLTFTAAQTGTVQIVGARRPRRTSQFQESQPVPTRNFNQTFSDIIATQRELWDKTNDFTGRGVFAPPGETLKLLPVLASRQNMGACFDSGGNLTSCVAIPAGTFAAGSGIVFTGVGPTTISLGPCSVFTSGAAGCVLASGGGTAKFLRADGTFATPAYPNNFQNVFNVLNYGAVANYNSSSNGSMSIASTTLSITSFTCNPAAAPTGDVGKYVAVQGAAAASATLFTTVASCSGANYVLAAANASGGNISAKLVEWCSDQATQFKAAITAAMAAGGGTVYFPAASYCVSQLDMTNTSVVTLAGDGPLSSKLFPLKVASYGTATGHLIDMTGASFLTFRDFEIGAFYELAAPTTGFFMAQVASNASNRILFKDLYISGQFTVATIYDYGVPSGAFEYSDFYNYSPGAGPQAAGIFSASNRNGLSSNFTTVTSGFQSTSNLKFTDVEFHKFAGAGADNFVVTLDGTTNLSFDTGVISGGATAYIGYYGTVSHISFPGNTFETESQPVVPLYGHYKNTSSVMTDITDVGASYVVGTGTFSVAPTATNLVKNAF
jgi:hypothetical protein